MERALTKTSLTSDQLRKIATKKIFFGHRSVGDNIIQGLRDLASTDSGQPLNIIHSDTLAGSGPMFLEFYIGENGNPQSKNEAFVAALGKRADILCDVAIFKYCYVDITATTDVRQVFWHYRNSIETLKTKYPGLTFVHVTVPLTTSVEPAWKAIIKSALGRTSSWDANARRNEFNALLRAEFLNQDPIFDLAEVESTHLDGTRSFVSHSGRRVYTLAPELAEDEGHLNKAGRCIAAEKLVATLACI